MLETHGYEIVGDVILRDWIEALNDVFALSTHGMRRLCAAVPAVRALADSPAIRGLVEPILGLPASVVRSIYFDKNAAANWKAPWHQDITIAVRERVDVPGCGPWSIKAGVPHVQPPVDLLARMLSVRIHLDDCDYDNGPLRVVPGSHRLGLLDAKRIREVRAELGEVMCRLGSGGVMLMRPLLLHASSAAARPRRRRVIHLEFAAEDLPAPLEWAEATPTRLAPGKC